MKTKNLLFLVLSIFVAPWAVMGQKTLPYEYGFENNNLAGEGWTKNGSGNSKPYETAKRTGSYGFRFYCSSLYSEQYLISPELSASDNGTVVEFYYKAPSTAQTFQVGYSITGSDVASDFTYGTPITTSDNNWNVFSQTFAAETKYIVIKYTTASSYTFLYLDDFSFEDYSEYPAPKNLILADYTSSTATLDWTGRSGQDHWDLYYTTSSTIPDAGTTPSVANTTTKPYTISNLESGVTYYAYVRGNYNNGEHYSNWSNACTFEVGCFTPIIAESMATCNQAYFSWMPVGQETSWQVAFSDQQGFDPDDVTPETVTMQYYYKENLTTGVTYYAHVRAVCGIGDYSDWSAEVSMTTECIAPSNLRATSVTPSTATLGWQQGSNESQWQISYSTTADFMPENGTIITVNTNTYTLEGLTINTPYYAYVRAVCTETIFSNWSSICTFMPKYELTVSDDETNYNMYVPFYGSYVSYVTKSQFIIPAAALTDLLYANINKLTFYSGVETANLGSATFDVLISELDGVAVFESSAFFDWSAMTSVYSGSLSVSNNKMEITLNNPYQYMGGDLLIGFNLTNSGNDVTAYWYGAATTGFSAYGGVEMPAYSYSSYNRYKFIPKTTFSYTPGTAPTCLKPTGLSISQGSGTATMTWTAGDGETHWNVQYKEASASEWSNVIAVENTPAYTLNDLLPMTTYQVRVQADCGSGDVSGWISSNFTTPCGSVNIPYTHDFDSDVTGNDLPPCWTKINDGESGFNDYPTITGSNANSASNCLYFYRLASYCGENQMAVLPEMNANVNTLQISFYAKLASGTNKPLAVGVMTNPDDKTTFVKIEDVTITSTEYAQYTVGFESYAGNGRFIAIKCEPDGYDVTGYYVDDIEVTANSVCFAPVNPQISDVTGHTATFTWAAGSEVTHWQVQYKKISETNWSESIAVNGTPSYSFSGLVAATDYQARVRTNCGDDNYSDWVTADFSTECAAGIPYSYNFDSDATGTTPPQCWNFIGGNYPRVYAGNALSAPNDLCFYHQNDNVQQLVALPEMDLTTYTLQELQIVFWARVGSNTSLRNLMVGVMTDPNDASTFTSVETVSPGTAYNEFTVSFENYNGTGKYIAIRDFSYNSNNTSFYIDDITVEPIPSCKKPGRPYVDSYAIQAHQAFVSWSKGSEDQSLWQFALGTDENFDPDEVTPIDVDVTNEDLFNDYGTGCSYYLTGLSAAITYYLYVRANCGTAEEPDYSDWNALPRSFTTIGCDIPNQLSMLDYTATTAWLSWNTGSGLENDYTLAYSENEYFDPDDSEQCTYVTGITETGYTLEGLTAETIYYARVRANCGADGYSEWSDQLEFMPSAIHSMTVYDNWKIQNRAPLPLDYVDYDPDQDQQPMIGQYVLPEIELLDLRFSKIHNISLFTASSINLNSNALFNVYLKEVNEPTMSGFISFDVMTQVYSGVISIISGVMTITFDEPFYYTEGSLMIGFKQLTPGDKIYDAGAWRGIDPHVAACYTYDYWQEIEAPSFLPTTRFTYEPYNVPSCTWPIMLKALPMATFAKLSWSSGSGECDVRYKKVSDAEWTLVEGVSISTYEPYILRNLSPSTNYEYQVRKVCGENEYSDWSKSRTFTTRSGNVITINSDNQYVEDFDSAVFPPTDWVTESDSYVSYWHGRETTQEHYLVASSGYYNDAAMYSPELHIDAQSAVLYLNHMHSSSYNGTATYCDIMVSTDHGEHFTNLWGGMDATRVGDWIETRVSLDYYVGQDIVLKFYHFTYPTVLHSWEINDIRIKAFDKVFNGGDGSSWSDTDLWSLGNGELPTMDDEVLINSSVTISEGTVAQAGQIYLNDVENSTEIQGAITIEDGGQLQVNDTVTVTMQTDVNGYGRGGSNWYLIASPVQQNLSPSSNNVSGIVTGSYDLYAFDGSYEGAEWRNYKQNQNGFVFRNGQGYLVANSMNVSPSFKGTVLPSNQTKTIDLDFGTTTFGAWTLVGNPFTCEAYFDDGRSFYRMNEGGTALISASGVIHPMEGVFVEAEDDDESVTFTTVAPQTSNGNGLLNLTLGQNRGVSTGSATAAIDRAVIRFVEGRNLGKFNLMANADQLYIPQNGKNYAVVHCNGVGEMPLNFKAAANGTYTISVSVEATEMAYLHLVDNLEGTDIDLLQQPYYTFEAKYTDYPSRFKVVFASVCGNADDDNETFAFNNNGNWIILNEGRATLQVIDMQGRIINSETIDGSVETNIHAASGIYLMRLINGENVRVQKVVMR